ncbi:DgyrCDS10885 [Dimorphilus gyrociliatus]|uniref:DNA-directed RNA polymerase III subunit RPC3 n=1 Tax=Dimorphilus gyrociliatus TaxID=2664684 RepID=A0A7I8W2R5_9ANNE|nr:DgyrCDS10885 [Dimorphilus gyrociliatus]
MSSSLNHLCSSIISEGFGDIAGRVSQVLLAKGHTSLFELSRLSKERILTVKKCLYTFIHHNLVTFKRSTSGTLEYYIHTDIVLNRILFPKFIFTAKSLFGDTAEFIVEELCFHGNLSLDDIVKNITMKTDAEGNNQNIKKEEIHPIFIKLVSEQFIKRFPSVVGVEDGVPIFSEQKHNLYFVPPMADSEPPEKRQKTEETENLVLWIINYDRFHRYLRDCQIATAFERRIDSNACEIIKIILRISETRTDPNCTSTKGISMIELSPITKKELGISKDILTQYMSLLVEDSFNCVIKLADSGEGTYAIDLPKAMKNLATSHIESIIQEKFGSKAFRIFKVLLLNGNLEQQKIEDCVMIPAKEAKELLYRMVEQQYVSVTEVPKTSDHAPRSTFYLFSVNIDALARKLEENCYMILGNLYSRRDHEGKKSKRLLEKQSKIEAIALQMTNALDPSAPDHAQKLEECQKEIEEMSTVGEKEQIERLSKAYSQLDQAEMQTEELLFILRQCIHYSIPMENDVKSKKKAIEVD